MGDEERGHPRRGSSEVRLHGGGHASVGFGTPAGSGVVDLGALVCLLILGLLVVDRASGNQLAVWFGGSAVVLTARAVLSRYVRWKGASRSTAIRSAVIGLGVSLWFAVWWLWLLPRDDDVAIGVGLVTLIVVDVASAALLAAIPLSFAALAVPSGVAAAVAIATSSGGWNDRVHFLLPLALGVLAVYLDRRRAYQRALAGAESARIARLELELAFEGIRDGVAVTSRGVVLRCNEPMQELVGLAPGELVGRPLTEALGLPADHEAGPPRHVVVEGRDGPRTIEVEGRTALSRPELAVWVCRDVTARLQAERRLRQLIGHDDLTALANRRTMLEHLGRVLATQGPVSVLVIDLDGFKEINDQYGHAAGDQVLRVVAQRLLGRVHEQGQVSRMGGDEFVVVLNTFGAGQLGLTLAADLVTVLSEPILTDRGRVEVSASIGVAEGFTGEAPGDVLHRADVAMYQAKRSGRNAWHAASTVPEDPAP